MNVGYYQIFQWKNEKSENQKAIEQLQQLSNIPIVIDKIKDIDDSTPALGLLLKQLAKRDILYVWKLERFANSLDDLIKKIQKLEQKNVGIASVQEKIQSKLFAQKKFSETIVCWKTTALNIKKEAVLIGIDKARSNQRFGGRPPLMEDNPKIKMAEDLFLNTELSALQISQILQVSKPTFYSYLRYRGIKPNRNG